MRRPTPCRRPFSRATSRAGAETSVAQISARAHSFARETAMAPLPVPISRIRHGPGREARKSNTVSTKCSVSGRGMSTSGVTRNSRDQNSCDPLM